MFPLQWKSEIGVGDILTFLGFLAAAGGLVFTAVQLRLGTRVQRAQFLLDTTERYFADTDVRRLYYDIDYNKFSLAFVGGEPNTFQRGTNTPKPFIGSDEERWLDNLLYTFDVIGRVAELKALNSNEARLFAFQAARVFKNPDIVQYLAWLDKERIRFGGDVPSHHAARKLASLGEP
jgi:hypothetical protein